MKCYEDCEAKPKAKRTILVSLSVDEAKELHRLIESIETGICTEAYMKKRAHVMLKKLDKLPVW